MKDYKSQYLVLLMMMMMMSGYDIRYANSENESHRSVRINTNICFAKITHSRAAPLVVQMIHFQCNRTNYNDSVYPVHILPMTPVSDSDVAHL